MVAAEETRKGPWTEEEDMQLVCFVGLFGERRWDFIAKVSGLHRTGKSCRLRWVNYLHPGLKRGRMSPQEERLILELHARWGNRWSRIARRLPGRTDNEIKNYWRTHMRKKAQERKRNALASSSSTSTSTSTSTSSSASSSVTETHAPPGPSPADTWLSDGANAAKDEAYPMERIWEEIASAEAYANRAPPLGASPSLWDCCADPLWKVVEGADGGQHLWWDPPV